ncbi:OLC1v1007008C1 [Oldenlandia corymbosa var. corymbosa]|uniref:OLC1v1007008C1 n=1 Tax=Oldenlandia corymbosa var. corymbosa TaxID=529605 RepID=A0AAV1DIZ2_OLDCO|nr:OLC1v1007008C1 [Oldenlandia corymbosa var. corymbosa]
MNEIETKPESDVQRRSATAGLSNSPIINNDNDLQPGENNLRDSDTEAARRTVNESDLSGGSSESSQATGIDEEEEEEEEDYLAAVAAAQADVGPSVFTNDPVMGNEFLYCDVYFSDSDDDETFYAKVMKGEEKGTEEEEAAKKKFYLRKNTLTSGKK